MNIFLILRAPVPEVEVPVHHEILLAVLLVQKNSPPSLYRYVSASPLNISARPLNVSIVSNPLFHLSYNTKRDRLLEVSSMTCDSSVSPPSPDQKTSYRNPLTGFPTYRLSHLPAFIVQQLWIVRRTRAMSINL